MAKKKNAWLIVLIVLAAVVVCGIGAVLGLVGYVSNPQNAFSELKDSSVTLAPTATIPPTPTPDAEPSDEITVTPEPTATPEPTMMPPDYEFEKNRVNILLLGADSSVERVNAGLNFRTDTMILVTVNFDDKKVDMISIPRDSYVRINRSETRFNKINAAFTFGGGAQKDGYAYAMNTVSDLLGVKVDYYVGFGMNVVKEVVDAMGGVDYDVDIEFTMNGRKTEKGLQHMDGQKVLDYCRFRKGGRGDVDRVDRQQRILFAIFETMLKTNQVKNIPDIYTAVQENIDTNLDVMQIATLAYFAKDLSMDQIARHTVPGNGQYVGAKSYYIIYQDNKNQMVKEIFGVNGPYDEGITVEAIEQRVALEEGTMEGDEEQTGADNAASDPTSVTIEAEEMLAYVLDYADMDNADISAAYDALHSAVASGDTDAMTAAMKKIRALLPGA